MTPKGPTGRSWVRWLLRCFGLFLLCGAMPALAAMPLLVVNGTEPSVLLGPHVQVLEDATGQLTLADVQKRDHGWADFHRDTLSLGFSKSVLWARVRLQYAGPRASVHPVMDIGTALQDYADVYVLRPDGSLAQQVLTGDRRHFASRPVQTRVPSVPIELTTGQFADVYVKLTSHDGLQEAVVLKLWQEDAFPQAIQSETFAFGLYYGAIGTMLIYNLFLFISTRQRGFGLYIAYVASFLVWSFAFRGYALQYWWPDAPVFNNQMLPLAASACHLTSGLFLMDYMETRQRAPAWVHKLLLLVSYGVPVAASVALFGHYALAFALSMPLAVVQVVTGVSLAIRLSLQGFRPARYFVMAFSMLALGVLLYYLRVAGFLSSNAITENFLQIGSALEVLLLAFGLADQLNTLRAAKLHAERSALAAQAALNTELESLVKRRTSALESANRRLAEMAITDELTGAFNRRHFNTAFQAEVARHLRHRTPLVFCMLDIDQFKLYNDQYGHMAGDAVLQQVAAVVQRHLQRAGDQFFRLGGEEFGILLTVNEPPEKAAPFIESLRADIEKLAIPHEASNHLVVTASFGMVWVSGESPVVRPEDLYAAADELLYQAKAQGRNQVMAKAL